jgi:uncharacterized membrane protein (UPF0127 family)
MAWLVREGEVLASLELADGLAARVRGLLGRDGCEGALLLMGTRTVHSVGMRFALDVAFLDRELRVLGVTTLPPWRLARWRPRTRAVLEAEAGAFERWRLRPGDRLEVKA